MYSDKLKEIVKKIEKVLFDPINFFKDYKKEKEDFGEIIIYYVILSIIPAILGSISTFPMLRGLMGLVIPRAYAALIFLVYIFSILGMLIGAGVTHLFVWIVGGRKGILKTIAAVIYASTPSLLFGWIPVVGVITSFWTLALTIIGVSKLHKISYLRSIFAIILLPFIILSTLIVIFLFPFIPRLF